MAFLGDSQRTLTCVPKVQHRRNEFTDFKLDEEVEYAVEENVNGTSTGHDKTPPMPSVIFTTQLEVRHHNRQLSTTHDKNAKDQKQESKEVVKLILPNGAEHEEQLDEDSAKREDAGHERAHHNVHVPLLLWYLAWNHVRSNWMLVRLFSIAEIITKIHERHRNSEPEEK